MVRRREPETGGTIGRVGPDGTLTRFDVPRPPGELAEAPDGAVWAADDDRLPALPRQRRPGRATAGAVHRPVQLRFTPDGGLWLTGHTRLST